ncbi:MAG: hypothetical protein HY699_23715 [Deltaproteobacteria bacterium]|nr:hypothetical protein [Deltaproteobacteria bacterium]
MAGKRRQAAALHRAARGGVLLLLEIAMRAFRIPLFPAFAPLFSVNAPPALRFTVYAPLLLAIEMYFLGSAAWEFVAAVLAGLFVYRRLHSRLAFALASAVLWSLIGWATNHFPIGALGLETLLTSLLVRAAGSEQLAGFMSRLVFIALLLASVGLVALSQRGLRRLAPAAFAAAVLLGCAPADKEYFQPEASGDHDAVQVAFATPGAFEHPVLAEAARTNEVCLGCHGAKIGATDLPRAQKGVHEFHHQHPNFNQPCTFCHQRAGRPGFPGEYPRQGARSAYNQQCASCHTGDSGPYWARAF